jgi:molybdopterin-containing oxidoreductase family iron-sulfur binding subunit
VNRRDALRSALASIASAVTSVVTRNAKAEHAAPPKNKRRWGMVIDLDRCTGCGACAIACQEENNVPMLSTGYENRGAQIEWMSQLWVEPETEGGLPELLPFPCQHCLDAPCVKACPVGATFKDDEGLTVQNWERCIGCRYCMVACPYSRRSFNWDEPKFEGNLIQLLNPDVATRPRGVVEKCTFCSHRITAVKEQAAVESRPIRDAEVQHLTACASVCPGQAITFGDLNDEHSKVSEQAKSSRGYRLLEDLGTQPSVIYLKRDRSG